MILVFRAIQGVDYNGQDVPLSGGVHNFYAMVPLFEHRADALKFAKGDESLLLDLDGATNGQPD